MIFHADHSLKGILVLTGLKYRTNILSPVTIFQKCISFDFGNIFRHRIFLAVCTGPLFLVICQYMLYPSDRNLRTLKTRFKWKYTRTRYSNMPTALTILRILYPPLL